MAVDAGAMLPSYITIGPPHHGHTGLPNMSRYRATAPSIAHDFSRAMSPTGAKGFVLSLPTSCSPSSSRAMSMPAVPYIASMARPPSSVFLPAPPRTESTPAPPKSASSPPLPTIASTPPLPRTSSLPAPPLSVSRPGPPRMTSGPSPPVITSLPKPPSSSVAMRVLPGTFTVIESSPEPPTT